jgi:hypothetical protein
MSQKSWLFSIPNLFGEEKERDFFRMNRTVQELEKLEVLGEPELLKLESPSKRSLRLPLERRNFRGEFIFTEKKYRKGERQGRNILRTFSYTPEYPGKCCHEKTSQNQAKLARGFIGAPVPVIHVEIAGGTSNRDIPRQQVPHLGLGRRLHAHFLTKSYRCLITSYRHEIRTCCILSFNVQTP